MCCKVIWNQLCHPFLTLPSALKLLNVVNFSRPYDVWSTDEILQFITFIRFTIFYLYDLFILHYYVVNTQLSNCCPWQLISFNSNRWKCFGNVHRKDLAARYFNCRYTEIGKTIVTPQRDTLDSFPECYCHVTMQRTLFRTAWTWSKRTLFPSGCSPTWLPILSPTRWQHVPWLFTTVTSYLPPA